MQHVDIKVHRHLSHDTCYYLDIFGNIQNEDDAVTPCPHERNKNEYVAKTSQKSGHERKLDLSRQNHERDENSCSMNAK